MPAPTLLIVEDEAHTRRVVRRLMEPRGWVVVEAETVVEALEMMDPAPNCVLLDLMLPGGPGEALLTEIRRLGLPTRVVVLSAVAEDNRVPGAVGLGADRVLLKPVTAEALYRACEGGERRVLPEREHAAC